MKSDDLLRLLVIESSLEDAEYLLSTLRNAGIAPRPSSVEDIDELNTLLDKKPIDLIVLNPEVEGLDLQTVSNAVTRSGKDVPIIVQLETFDADNEQQALLAGATAATSSENSDHMVSVVKR